jgi:hypothetical protein
LHLYDRAGCGSLRRYLARKVIPTHKVLINCNTKSRFYPLGAKYEHRKGCFLAVYSAKWPFFAKQAVLLIRKKQVCCFFATSILGNEKYRVY